MIKPPGYALGDKWILSHRGPKNPVDPLRPYLFFQEEEISPTGNVEKVNTIFLTNAECPFKCLMCDLWKNTTNSSVRPGNIPQQIRWANSQLGSAESIKLYNSGNFFDRNAIPVEDYEEIAGLLDGFDRVIVESHPKLVGELCLYFNKLIKGELQVSIGLETVHPDVLPLLNKKMDLNDFRKSVRFLGSNGITSRAFILLKPPFLSDDEGVEWTKRSIDFSISAGVECNVIIPTRVGNGAMEQLHYEGYFDPPVIKSLEKVLEYGIQLQKGRVLGDLWDIEKFSTCSECLDDRIARINEMNLTQRILQEINCPGCGK